MEPLLRLVLFVGEVFIAVWMLLATASFVYGLIRFLIAAPGAIQHDLERWRRQHAERFRMRRHPTTRPARSERRGRSRHVALTEGRRHVYARASRGERHGFRDGGPGVRR
jgi:hypothetical protein